MDTLTDMINSFLYSAGRARQVLPNHWLEKRVIIWRNPKPFPRPALNYRLTANNDQLVPSFQKRISLQTR